MQRFTWLPYGQQVTRSSRQDIEDEKTFNVDKIELASAVLVLLRVLDCDYKRRLLGIAIYT